MSVLPEQLPGGKTVTVTNIANSRTIIARDDVTDGGKSAKAHRIVLGRAADRGREDEPEPTVTLKSSEAAKWWPVLRRFATGTDEYPPRISVAVS